MSAYYWHIVLRGYVNRFADWLRTAFLVLRTFSCAVAQLRFTVMQCVTGCWMLDAVIIMVIADLPGRGRVFLPANDTLSDPGSLIACLLLLTPNKLTFISVFARLKSFFIPRWMLCTASVGDHHHHHHQRISSRRKSYKNFRAAVCHVFH